MANIGIIGTGRMGRSHADALKKVSGAKLFGAYDSSGESAKKFAADYDMEKVYTTSGELAHDNHLDAVMVCSPTFTHYQVLKELMGSGKTIFCEKPLARHTEEGEKLLALAEAAKARVMIGYNRRYMPSAAKLREIIADGRLGTILMAKIAYNHCSYNRQWGDWFADFELCGGVTLDMMSHQIDLLNWYFGAAERVYGDSIRLNKDMPEPMDYVSATVIYKNGVICNIDGSWQRYGKPYNKIEIYGDRATALLSDGQLQIFAYGKSEIYSWGDFISSCMLQAQAFMDFITSGTPPLATIQDGYDALRIADAINTAAIEKRVINLPEN